MPSLENQRVLHFEFQCQKLLTLYLLTFCYSPEIYLQNQIRFYDLIEHNFRYFKICP